MEEGTAGLIREPLEIKFVYSFTSPQQLCQIQMSVGMSGPFVRMAACVLIPTDS